MGAIPLDTSEYSIEEAIEIVADLVQRCVWPDSDWPLQLGDLDDIRACEDRKPVLDAIDYYSQIYSDGFLL